MTKVTDPYAAAPQLMKQWMAAQALRQKRASRRA